MGDEKSINIGGDNLGTNIIGDNNDIHLPPHIIQKVLTTQTGLANEIDFVGRKEELKKVDELLNQNATLLLLNGIGGIGKSTLASYYLNQKKDEFDYYGFVQVNEDIKLSLASAFSTSLDLKSEKIDDLFNETMNKLQNLEGKKLLIIDDVKEMDNQLDEMNTLMTLKNSGFQILFTSRETKEYIPQYFLDIMSVEDARELFLKYYPTDEINKVDKILEYLDYHTLFIEITAKTLRKRRDTLSLDETIKKFDNGEFTTVKRNKSESFNKFLKNFSYDSVILTQKKNLIFLKRLSVLPSIEISFENLYKFLVCEDKERLQDFVIELIDNGWLIKLDNGYKFHQILKEFIFDNYLPSFKEIENILHFFMEEVNDIRNEEFFLSKISFFSFYILLGNSFQKIEQNSKIGRFFYHLSNFYFHLKDWKACLKYQKIFLDTINIDTELEEEQKKYDLALVFSSLSSTLRNLKKYKKALAYLDKALVIRKELLGEKDKLIGMIHLNKALIYYAMQKKSLAIVENKKALENFTYACDERATIYHNLGLSYEIDDDVQSLNYFLKSLKARKKFLKTLCSPSLLLTYQTIISTLVRLEFLEQALFLSTYLLGVRERCTENIPKKYERQVYPYVGIPKVLVNELINMNEDTSSLNLLKKQNISIEKIISNNSRVNELFVYEDILELEISMEVLFLKDEVHQKEIFTSCFEIAQLYKEKNEFKRAIRMYKLCLNVIEDDKSLPDRIITSYSILNIKKFYPFDTVVLISYIYSQLAIIYLNVELIFSYIYMKKSIAYLNFLDTNDKIQGEIDTRMKLLVSIEKNYLLRELENTISNFGKYHNITAFNYFELTKMYFKVNETEKSKHYFNEMFDVFEKISPSLIKNLKNNQSNIKLKLSVFKEFEEYFRVLDLPLAEYE